MSTTKNNRYLARNEEGFLCAYDSETKKCVDVIIGTGENVSNEKIKTMLGKIDPKFK